jgi:ATP-binding cassette, subfamily C (CFTR/MRP), member 4
MRNGTKYDYIYFINGHYYLFLLLNFKKSENNILQNLTFEVKENELLAIVGSVGSGKSSLLMSLLGEMPSINGNIKINGSIFYVTQEPWIFSSSIKQNILFGKEYVKEKFDKIIKICALKDVRRISN